MKKIVCVVRRKTAIILWSEMIRGKPWRGRRRSAKQVSREKEYEKEREHHTHVHSWNGSSEELTLLPWVCEGAVKIINRKNGLDSANRNKLLTPPHSSTDFESHNPAYPDDIFPHLNRNQCLFSSLLIISLLPDDYGLPSSRTSLQISTSRAP